MSLLPVCFYPISKGKGKATYYVAGNGLSAPPQELSAPVPELSTPPLDLSAPVPEISTLPRFLGLLIHDGKECELINLLKNKYNVVNIIKDYNNISKIGYKETKEVIIKNY
jgi:hypothetical protein